MRSISRIGFGGALGLLALACSGGSLGNLGAGGSGGTGGVLTGEGPGNGGRGGAAGGPGGTFVATTLVLPGCLQELLSTCTPKGICVFESFGATGITCFETGAHGAWGNMVAQAGACPNGKSQIPVTRSDGSLCYQYEWYADASTDCRLIHHTWKDAAGNTVASGTQGPGVSISITCDATGERATCGEPPSAPMSAPCCSITAFGGALCPDGMPNPACSPGICSTT